MTKLIVGLGNPGAEYANTRHNLGFDAVDALVSGKTTSPEISKKLNAIIYKLGDVVLLKPQTFMNLSHHSRKDTKLRSEKEVLSFPVAKNNAWPSHV